MLNYYQPFLLPFLHHKTYSLPRGVRRKLYISFEDALWNLLASQEVPKKSVILIPNFYCMDVIENIRMHGYTPILYPLNEHFQIIKKEFETYRKKYKPSVIIFFHACGVQNALLLDTRYIQYISKSALIIEDAVQRLVNPSKVSLVSDTHVLIDSLRKTSPLHGSFLYGRAKIIETFITPIEKEYVYQIETYLLFLLFKIVFSIGVALKSQTVVRFAHLSVLKKHDDIIGDNTSGHAGPMYVAFLHRFIHFTRIEQKKIDQTKAYMRQLNAHLHINMNVQVVTMKKSDYKNLHVFPLVFRLSNRLSHKYINSYFRSRKIPVWTKFPDCPWSKTHAALFLPLGFHVRYNEIEQVCKNVTEIAIV